MKTRQSRNRQSLVLAMAVLLFLAAAPSLFATGKSSQSRCVVKFVCGESLGESELSTNRAVAGSYRTAINILNATTKPLSYTKALALTTPCGDEAEAGFELPGRSPVLPTTSPLPPLLSMDAFDVDCNEIRNEFLAGECPNGGGNLDFIEGFLILQSNGPLNVTAVYTAGNPDAEEGGVSSIDVENVTCSTVTTVSSNNDDDDDD